MDFGQFSTKRGGSEGRFLHFRHLQTKEFLFEEVEQKDGTKVKEPVGVWVRSMESPEVQAAVAKRNRKIASGKPVDEDKGDIARALVVRFQHIHRKDGDGNKVLLQPTDEDIDWFFSLTRDFTVAMLNFANDPGNFIGTE